MLESPHQNRLIMENSDFKETFFSQERENWIERERERREEEGRGQDRSGSPGLRRGHERQPIPTVIVIMLWGRGDSFLPLIIV